MWRIRYVTRPLVALASIQLIQAGSNNRQAGARQKQEVLEANVHRMEEMGAIKLNQENGGWDHERSPVVGGGKGR